MEENKLQKKIVLEEIEKKRSDMLEEAKQYGISSPTVQKKSEELDELIIAYMKS